MMLRLSPQQESPAAPVTPPQDAATNPLTPSAPAPSPSGNSDFSIRLGDNGWLSVTTDANGVETVQSIDINNVIPPQVTDFMLIGVLGIIGMILAFPIGRAIARYIDRRGAVSKAPDDITRRLAAIDDGVQAMAVEVERLSESNRYTARLLTERVAAPDFRAAELRDAPKLNQTPEATPESGSPRSTWQAS